MKRIVIAGAGLAGALAAIFLARRGFEVEVFESRQDPRTSEKQEGRSINLALSNRGIAALRKVGMEEIVGQLAIPMHGRMIHPENGKPRLLPYSGRKNEFINSVSRSDLNIALINKADSFDNVKIHFSNPCLGFDCKQKVLLTKGNEEITADAFIAADGAGSQIRRSLLLGGVERFDYMQSWLAHGYKELTIPPRNGDFALEPNALHIWPRHSYMMIALPNLDRSFTCTLFLSHSKSGQTPGFDQFQSAESVKAFFKAEFEDAFDLMPGLVEDFFNHPTGNLGTVRCSPWHVEDRLLLIGDAAHAIVPFYGQGMNCAFEDVRILDEMIEQHEGDWQQLFQKFESERKPNTDAIAELAEENFYEMRDATADPVFIRKRELETKLESLYQDFYSKYSMVTFRDDLPYSVAKVLGNEQDRLLTEIAASCEDIGQLDLEEVRSKIRQFYDKAAALK